LYNPRNDANCRRTIDGFSPIADAPTSIGQVVRVRFKRWANLKGRCRFPLISVRKAVRDEQWLNSLARMATKAPHFGAAIGRPGLLSRAVRRIKGAYMKSGENANIGTAPDYFLLEAYNPTERSVGLSLVATGVSDLSKKMPFQRLLDITPGFNRITIPFSEINPLIGRTDRIDLRLNPNILDATDEGLTLFFGLICFARDAAYRTSESAPKELSAKVKKVKVVIWDLDNTVWDGTLVENGAAGIKLKHDIAELIKELDRRGIVNSIASKNDEVFALDQLERFGLREYFVFPVIGWGPKSEAIQQIRGALNVGEDTLAFIDDQAFEREEVKARYPLVRVYSHEQCANLLNNAEFDTPITQEAQARRAFYKTEEVRREAVTQYSGRYLEFLQKSKIIINITKPTEDNFERIHEIAQRTNQMNFSGTRYSKDDVRELLADPARECFLVSANDKYGYYGYIGFCVVSPRPMPRVLDLMFSCRIQSKRVEHAFFIFLMERYAAMGAPRFVVRYRETDRNKPLAQVFGDLGFAIESKKDGEFHYAYDLTGKLPKDSIIAVEFTGRADAVGVDRALSSCNK
jgi:FkbH-like protein